MGLLRMEDWRYVLFLAKEINPLMQARFCISLWRAVIDQQLTDAFFEIPPKIEITADMDEKQINRAKYRAARIKELTNLKSGAVNWLTSDSIHFKDICDWADISPDQVKSLYYKKLKEFMKNQEENPGKKFKRNPKKIRKPVYKKPGKNMKAVK